MTNLIFTQVGDEFVSDNISAGGESVIVQLKAEFSEKMLTMPVSADITLDESTLGWAQFDKQTASEHYAFVIKDIPDGATIRLRCPVQPLAASYSTF